MTEYIPLVEWESISGGIVLGFLAFVLTSMIIMTSYGNYLDYLDRKYGWYPDGRKALKKKFGAIVGIVIVVIIILCVTILTFSVVSQPQVYSINDPNFETIEFNTSGETTYIRKNVSEVGNVVISSTNPDSKFRKEFSFLKKDKRKIPQSMENSLKEGDGLKFTIINKKGEVIEEKTVTVYHSYIN